MKKARFIIISTVCLLLQLQALYAQTDAELVQRLKDQVARISTSASFSFEELKRTEDPELSISRDNYSFTLEGKGSFMGIPDVEILAYFTKSGSPNYFRALLPTAKTAGNLNLDALAAGPDWKNFFLPSVLTDRFMFSSWVAEFNTDKNRVSKLALRFRVAGNLTPIDGWDLNLDRIEVGYDIENPYAPAKNPADSNYEKSISGQLSATMNAFGAEINISSNLVTDIKDWELSTDMYSIKIPLSTLWEKMKGDRIFPWPAFMNNFEVSKLQVDIKPLSELSITAWTNPLGNFHFMVRRSKTQKDVQEPLSTQLSGGYTQASTGTTSTSLTGGYTQASSGSTSTSLTGGYTQASSGSTSTTSSTSTTTTSTSTTTTTSAYEILAAYSLPENLEFGGGLTLLNSFRPSNAGIVVSTFKDPTDNTLPIFAGLGSGNTLVRRGVTFLALVDIENFRQQSLKTVLRNVTKYFDVTSPLNSILFKAHLPLPPQPFSDFSAMAALNFSKQMNLFRRVYFKDLSLEAKPAAGDPEFSLYGTIGVVWDNPDKPLLFKGGFGINAASLTVTGKAQMDGALNLPNPYGFPKVSFANLALTAGIKFSTEIPTPDNLFLSGQMRINDITGNATIGLDQNEFNKNMVLARFCNLDFNNIMDAFCGPEITNKIPRFIRNKIGGTGIKNVYIKLIPPGASTNFIGGPPPDPGFTEACANIPTVKENDFDPGFKLAGQAQVLNWDGNFVFGFEGTMSSLSAGLTAIGNMAPLKFPFKIGSVPVFELTGAGGRGRPELFVDLSTRHLMSGITNKFSALRSESSVEFVPAKSCFLQARHSGRAFDIAGASKQMEAKVQQFDLNRSAAQEFVFEPAADGYYSIRNVNSGMYLDVHMGLAQAGRKIWQYVGNGSPAQLFKPVMNSSGYFELESKLNPNLVVEVTEAAFTNGAELRINHRVKGSFNQQFRQLMADMAADPSTATGYRENQVVYGSGRITVLGVSANAYLDLNTNGFQCNLNGKILGFMEGNMQVTIADFGDPLKGTSVTGSADQKFVQVIQDKARDAVKAIFGSRMANVFGSISSKLLDVRSITFSGNLDAMKSGVKMKVIFAVNGKEYTANVNADVNDVAAFAKKLGEEIARLAKLSFNALMDEAEKVIREMKQLAEKALNEMQDAANKAVDFAKNTSEAALKTANELKNDLASGAKTAAISTRDGFITVGNKTRDFFVDFGKFTRKTVEKIFNKAIDQLDNGWDSFTSAVKKAFTGGDNEERIMTDGPAFRIITRHQNYVLTSTNSTKKNYPVVVAPGRGNYLENWQLVPNDKNDEGSFFLVSGYSGLLVAKPLSTHLTLIPHESDHKGRERMMMESVPNEQGWFYLRYHKTEFDKRLNATVYTFAELKQVTVNNLLQWVLAPVEYAGARRPGNTGKFRFEKTGDIDWKKTKSFPPAIILAAPLQEGGRYQFNGEPEQYIYSEGKFRWIPDVETLVAGKWDAKPLTVLPNNQQVSTVLSIPIPSRKSGALVQAQNDPAVYIIHNGVRRWIPDVETFNMMGLNSAMIQSVTPADLQAIPAGDPLPSRFVPGGSLGERALYRQIGDPSVYVIINQIRRGIPNPETLLAMGYNWGHVKEITAQVMNSLPKGDNVPNRANGMLVQVNGQPAVYLMESGLRRPIPDAETFNALKLNWNNIQKITQADMNEIPSGPAIPSVK